MEPGISLEPLPGPSLDSIREDWLALERVGCDSPFGQFSWLASWADHYRPQSLHTLRVIGSDGSQVALGLLEETRTGRMQFAGGAVTPIRALLTAPGHREAAWQAVARWLNGAGGPTELSAWGVEPSTPRDARALVRTLPWLELDLPGSFEEYMAARSPDLRRNFRRRLRLAEREGLSDEQVADEDVPAALASFVRLHRIRASAKGEVHATVDDRLAAMLAELAHQTEPRLRVNRLVKDGRSVAVGITLEARGEAWFYNVGFDPEVARLSPGIVLRLASIRDAIGSGAHRCDLGPGEFAYKHDLGGVRRDRLALVLLSRSLPGRARRFSLVSRRRTRRLLGSARRRLIRRGA